MTVRATASLSGDIPISVTGELNNFYNATFRYTAVDDAVSTGVFEEPVSIQIPYALKPRKADDFIRQAISNAIFANHGLTIDPDDIYLPMVN